MHIVFVYISLSLFKISFVPCQVYFAPPTSSLFLKRYDGASLLNVEDVTSSTEREAFFYKIPKHSNGTGNSLEKDSSSAATVCSKIDPTTTDELTSTHTLLQTHLETSMKEKEATT